MFRSSSETESERADEQLRERQIASTEIKLLYSNLRVAVWVTLVAATVLAYLQWKVVPHPVIAAWWFFMALISGLRWILGRLYGRASTTDAALRARGAAFAVGAGMAGTGWALAAVFLYPPGDLQHQVILVFMIGGMMLGASSLLAPRREAFLAFLLPAGLAPAARLVSEGNGTHAAMGLMAALFTVAIVGTTSRIHRTIHASLGLQFENRDLVEGLREANARTEALNQQLEGRVEERTAALQQSNQRLRAEIEQREQAEEELLRARKLESLGVLAGGIAHDLNNFLTVVQGNLELARLRLDSGEPSHELLDQIGRACQRAKFLSSQLLTFAKGGAPVRRVSSVATLLMDAVNLARAGAPTSIDVRIAEDLWFAEVDPGQISQVLHNILLNARQAMPEGGIIEVRAENVSESNLTSLPCVKISIRDYGPGIPTDILPRIFDPYFTTKPGGTGLGLATAYAIVAKHGGHIGVDSKAGSGTVFSIFLPASHEPPEPEPGPGDALLHRGTGRVLVMDDEDALRKLLETVVARLGYEVESARDGAEAIALHEAAKASGRAFDVVLLDLTVRGGMGGIEAAARIRELEPSVKLIVSSGYSDAAIMSGYRSYGFDDVIPKPWSAAELSEVFRRVLVLRPVRKTPEIPGEPA